MGLWSTAPTYLQHLQRLIQKANIIGKVQSYNTNVRSILPRFDDIGTYNVSQTCPTQLHKSGKNRFRARAIFEALPGQGTFFNGRPSVATTLKAAAEFTNGSTWTADFDVSVYPTKLTTESSAFEDKNGWLVCKNGWKVLPSGKSICYVESSKDLSARREQCEKAGAYLMELQTRDDYQAFLYFMFEIAKTATSSFALGAKAKQVGAETIWVWENSGDKVDVCAEGCFIKTSSDEVDVDAKSGNSLYMDIVNAPSSTTIYLQSLPYFDLHVRSASETDATYYICMKDGEGSSATAATLTARPVNPVSLNHLQIYKIDYTLKTGHRTQFPFSLTITPNNYMRVCRLKLSHVGKNFPCLKDPTYGYKGDQNSSEISYSLPSRKSGMDASVRFDMVSNWGRMFERSSFTCVVRIGRNGLQPGCRRGHYQDDGHRVSEWWVRSADGCKYTRGNISVTVCAQQAVGHKYSMSKHSSSNAISETTASVALFNIANTLVSRQEVITVTLSYPPVLWVTLHGNPRDYGHSGGRQLGLSQGPLQEGCLHIHLPEMEKVLCNTHGHERRT